MKKQLLCLTALASLSSAAHADFLGYQNGFADLNVNYLDWSRHTENKSKDGSRKTRLCLY